MTAYAVSDTVAVTNLPLLSGALLITGTVVLNVPVTASITASVTVPNQLGVTVTGSTGLHVSSPVTAPLWITGSVFVSASNGAMSAVRTFVSASVTDVLILSANLQRRNVIIYNDSNASLYLGLGPVPVTSNDFTMVVLAHTVHEGTLNFIGELRGAWQTADGGVARVTELT